MTKCQPIIAVADVAQSSKWYQELLDCKGIHGGTTFEMLMDEKGELFLCLHAWEEHDHPTMKNRTLPADNGLIIYLTVENLDAIWKKARRLKASIEKEPAISTNSHRKEFAVRDPDGYYLLITQ
ncbi:MAG: glyoxalase [Owenweeksia sp.]|nr:glyoxalase [Owenweeksia sp.]MBF98665.1 glyoxalase [Owenweeksia sp.]HBF20441.1 glyoxalase [Cryomorphaceae bacterium]HCQ14668.1 glyoxalase [Cryomorphaceae bacterium]|tara:strand:- start:229 stop:600 length:372 start_codon:yes stop_codon:yes gene_type:complete